MRLLDDPERASRGGWAFDPDQGFKDPVFGAQDLREIYDRTAGDSSSDQRPCVALSRVAPFLGETKKEPGLV